MKKQYYSVLSIVFFLLAVFPLIAGLTKWGNDLYAAVLNVSIFLPLIFGLAGLTFALLGKRGKVKISLVLVNVLSVALSLFLVFVAMYGFQQA
ncbi:hypothetical protein FZC79_05000 [Rossellomorea vietnamensis]|uniref:Uncharacterized protein n=1 Tax=Rossellomorea vietnamensis TaxID=218284 RepID=A0A5D4KJA4_9BACI|nr:hypothetical protein [Rossellomorea vietnamensis]TYR77056.1 hypothetical protein FZC79_05000 [Rossellomorea vietnamensis]